MVKALGVSTPWVYIPGAWSTAGFTRSILPAAIAAQLNIEPLPECRPDAPQRVWGQWGRGRGWLNQRLNAHTANGPVILFAHSLGVQYALSYATHYPGKVAALVLLAPTYGRWWPLRTGWQALKLLRHRPHTWWARLMLGAGQHNTPRARIIVANTPMPVRLAATLQIFTVIGQLGRGMGHLPPCPVLAICATDDGFVPTHRPLPGIETWHTTGGHFTWLGNAGLWQRIEGWLAAQA